ncbi:hypothetical protein LXL04_018504 [Taraxacum kok-saghyz]
MASSSVSPIHRSFKYDVFLSFRGEDTRKNFIDHLYSALHQKSIHTYKDDEKIKKGKRISDELIGAIADSRFYIIVFSKDYASSSWCLEELVTIMEYQKMTEHTAYPVFYDVEPAEIRKQSGAVEKAFAKHKHEKEEDIEKWRKALKEAADLAGWELKNSVDGHEAKFIRKIIEELSLELRSINFSIDKKLVGMETRIQGVVSSLGIGFRDVRMIGIKGMGGGGKTTLARAIFDQICHKFDGKSFVENVKEDSKPSLSGLKSLQKQVLSDVLNDDHTIISSVGDGKILMKKMMSNKKVLVVLDDVDRIEQLEALVGEPDWFGKGTRIIITTRDEQLLVAHRVKLIHNVNLLSHEEAICLLSRYAFGREIPSQGYEMISKQVVHYASGLPLTIRVLGSFLCGKDKQEWADAIERLKTIPLTETLEKLELSYNGLEEDYKEMFLDVACLLKGETKDYAILALESCGFYARNGLKVLQQKSLITIDHNYDNEECVGMHDHIEEMGWNIVRRMHPDKPNQHSRLQSNKDIEDILTKDLGTDATRCIQLRTKKLDPGFIMEGLKKMKELRYLDVCVEKDIDANICGRLPWNWKFNKVSPYFPNTIRYLRWRTYPFRSLPRTFQANDLVSLEIDYSEIVQLWEGGQKKVLNKLKFLDLYNSRLRTLDLGLTPNLKTLTLRGSNDLVELHMRVGCLKLIYVDISCSKLRILDICAAENLEVLVLKNCYDLVELHMPNACLNLRSIHLSNSKLRTIDLRQALNLEILRVEECDNLVELHMHRRCLNLRRLVLIDSNLRTLNIGKTPNLEYLNLGNNCNLEELHMADECQKLAYVNLSYSKLRTLDLRLAPNLMKLELTNCCNLLELKAPIEFLKKLLYLNLSGCSRFSSFLFETTDDIFRSVVSPSDELHLVAKSLEICPFHPESNLPKLRFECFYKKSPPALNKNLEKLISFGLCACTNFETFSGSICGLQNLRNLTLEGGIPEAPKDLHQLKHLEELSLLSTNIKNLPDNICMLKHLKSLKLESCWLLEKLPEDIGRLECLENLTLSCAEIKHLPDSICTLKNLKSLVLFCWFLEKLPEDLDRLKSLEKLSLSSTKIKDLPHSIVMLKNLESLELNRCSLLEKLPEDLGRLERLEKLCLIKCKLIQDILNNIRNMGRLQELHLEGGGIIHLPQSIILLKGLCILGSRELLESFGFTSTIKTTEDQTLCYLYV